MGSRLLLCSLLATVACASPRGLLVKAERGDVRRHRPVPCQALPFLPRDARTGFPDRSLAGMTKCFCSQRGDQSLVLCLPKEWDGEFASTALLAVRTGGALQSTACYSEGSVRTIVGPVERDGEIRTVAVEVLELPQVSWCSGSMTSFSGLKSQSVVQGILELPAE